MNILSYDEILYKCLENIPNDIDKREGSLIRTAISPICLEIARFYQEISNIYELNYFDTSYGEYLDKVANQFGVSRKEAISAIRKGVFYDNQSQLLDIPLNSRFFKNNVFYYVESRISKGCYRVVCEQSGEVGNKYFGEVFTANYIENLDTAILSDVIIAGEEKETDSLLKERLRIRLNNPRFGGNISDYKDHVMSIKGVGGVRVYPQFNGGGTVKISFVTSNFDVPSDTLVEYVQNNVDPKQHLGEGYGIAPIGHSVTVVPAVYKNIDISFNITFRDGWDIDNLKPYLIESLNSYFKDISSNFSDEKSLVVRISYIESNILSLDGVLDISGTCINGVSENLILTNDEIPKLGEIYDT